MSLEAPVRETQTENTLAAGERGLTYSEAINDALTVAMERDDSVFIIGQNVTDKTGVFGTCLGLADRFGAHRVIEAPLSETATAGFVTGAAIRGQRPVLILNRPDFLFLMMDQLVNHASKWHYMFNGTFTVPLTVWGPVARGWGTACQHTQALHGMFMHLPGFKVVTPSNGTDAKGLLLESIFDDNPVMFFDHRRAMRLPGVRHVPEGYYTVPLGSANVLREGRDVTVISLTLGIFLCQEAVKTLGDDAPDVELVDLRSIKPWDRDLVLSSVRKTGRAVIVDDSAWPMAGMAAEISATISEELFSKLKAPVRRVTLPDAPAPSSYVLENAYYPDADGVADAIRSVAAFGR